MAQISEFVRLDFAFDSEVATILVAAYDQAIIGPQDKGQAATIREIVAKRIIELAAAGERDPDKLSQATLATFGISLGWNRSMSRQDALDEANARRAELAKLFQKPAATVIEAVKIIQPPVSSSAELVATARAAKLQRTEKANSIRMNRLHR